MNFENLILKFKYSVKLIHSEETTNNVYHYGKQIVQ